ncbi:MAG: Gfo/Idh/MocA family oxidoreductase [Hyphomicrobiales bacterium]|nr:Gfo/Idh/MocA family oxidoreductase [Hyphomicrobiales bacterium]
MTKDPVRWGIISTANIGTQKVIPGMMKSRDIDIRAIASRTLPTARRWAKKLGIPVAYGSYEDMLNDPEIEAVYNPLPNHLHVPLTLEAAAKGKHVLCEKPIAMSADEAKTMRAAARKVHIAEAFMMRCHPQWLKARALVQDGRLGTIRAIQALFSYHLVDPKNVRNIANIGGGALYDIGCYPIVTARFLLDAEPVRCFGLIDRDPKFRTDRTTSAVIDFGKGRHLTFTVSTQATPYQRVQILGDKARLEVEIPYNAPQGGAMKLYLDSGKQLADASAKTIKLPKADQYQLQGEWFSKAVRGKQDLTFGLSDAIRQARAMDAVFRSAKSGSWEKP